MYNKFEEIDRKGYIMERVGFTIFVIFICCCAFYYTYSVLVVAPIVKVYLGIWAATITEYVCEKAFKLYWKKVLRRFSPAWDNLWREKYE